MEIINELEAESRGLYTGAIGYILPNNDFHFNVPIRTIVMNKRNQCEMGIGSGIIYESNAKAEFEECILKADFLTNLNNNFYLIDGFKLKQYVIDERLDEITAELKDKNENCKVRLCAYQNGDVDISYETIPKSDDSIKTVIIGKQQISSRSIFQYHQTSRREVYINELAKAKKVGYYDAIILNEHNEVAEGCIHNLFIRKDGQLITPPIKAGVLHGIYRQKIIDTEKVIEKRISLNDLKQADEILLCNSVRGLVSVELAGG